MHVISTVKVAISAVEARGIYFDAGLYLLFERVVSTVKGGRNIRCSSPRYLFLKIVHICSSWMTALKSSCRDCRLSMKSKATSAAPRVKHIDDEASTFPTCWIATRGSFTNSHPYTPGPRRFLSSSGSCTFLVILVRLAAHVVSN
jgi:hypothetical protein